MFLPYHPLIMSYHCSSLPRSEESFKSFKVLQLLLCAAKSDMNDCDVNAFALRIISR